MKALLLTFVCLLGTAEAAIAPVTEPRSVCAKALLPRAALILENYSSGPLIMRALEARGIPVEVGGTLPLPEWGAPSFKSVPGRAVIEAFSVDDELVTRLKKLNIGAIFQGADSNAAFIIDQLNEQLGLPGNPSSTTAARRFKGSTQNALGNAELAHIRGVTTSDVETAIEFGLAAGYPLYVKPNDDGGSAFCFKVFDASALRDAFKNVREGFNVTTGKGNEKVRVEAYVPGLEYAVQGVVSNGVVKISSILQYDKIPVEGHGELYRSEWAIPGDSEEAKLLIAYVIGANRATQMYEGAFHWEVKIHAMTRLPVGIELNSRIVGSKLPLLLGDAVGYSDADLLVESVYFPEEFRARPDVYTLKSHVFRYMIHTPRSGMTLNEEALARLTKIPGFQRFRRTEFEGSGLPETVDLDTIPLIIEFLLPDTQSTESLRAELIEMQKAEKFFD